MTLPDRDMLHLTCSLTSNKDKVVNIVHFNLVQQVIKLLSHLDRGKKKSNPKQNKCTWIVISWRE